MALHKEHRILSYSPQQLFELVADVERYPEFLPLWQEVHVTSAPRMDAEDYVYFTEQVIQLGPVRKRFRTKTRLWEFTRILVTSTDPLFRRFSIDWVFIEGEENSCKIEFSLDCEASSAFLRPMFDIALQEAGRSIVSAFEGRARDLYGY